jgi:hypothetical protein
MRKTTVRLQEQLYTALVQMAAEQEVSLSQLINATLARTIADDTALTALAQRAQRARPGAMRRVLDHTAVHALPPLSSEDTIPSGFDRHVLEQRLRHEDNG